jgi:multiple sugar transport system permease protein
MIGFMTGLQAIPQEINESAALDGATGMKNLRYISLPLLRRTIGLLLVLSVSGSLLAFDQFYIITAGRPEGQTQTIAFYLFRQAFLAFRLGYGAALSVILAVLLMIISLIQIKLSRMDTHE